MSNNAEADIWQGDADTGERPVFRLQPFASDELTEDGIRKERRDSTYREGVPRGWRAISPDESFPP